MYSPKPVSAKILGIGGAAGILNGLLGTGGGLLIILALGAVFPEHDAKDDFVTAMAAMLPLSLLNAIKGSSFAVGNALYLIPAAIGGIVGAVIAGKLKSQSLRIILAAISAVAGINMIVR